MLVITNRDLFGKVVAKAVADARAAVKDAKVLQRWVNAIAKAAVKIEEDYTYMNWDVEGKFMLIMSENSNDIYEANGKCQCKAFDKEVPCWHRAAARIWANYLRELNGEGFTVKTLTTNFKRIEFNGEKWFETLEEAKAYCVEFEKEICAATAKVFHKHELVYEHEFEMPDEPMYFKSTTRGENFGGIFI